MASPDPHDIHHLQTSFTISPPSTIRQARGSMQYGVFRAGILYRVAQVVIYHYYLMYNTFQVDIDEDLTQNKSSLKNQLNERADNKFMAGTITKNFFASAFDEDESEYTSKASPGKREQAVEKEQLVNEGRGRREKRQGSTLAPIHQTKQVQVFQNYQRNSRNDQIEDIELGTSEPAPLAQSEIKKRSPRRRVKKEEHELESPILEKKEQKGRVNQEIRLPPKPTQIFFDEDLDEQLLKEESQVPINIAQKRLNNQFIDSDDEPIVVTTQQVQNVITGSQYFNFSNEVALMKQFLIDVREKTTLRMEIIRDKDGFNTFWPEFHLHFSEDSHYVMSAKKTSSRPTSTFILSRTRNNFEEDGPQYLGKMKSNVLGDVLNIFGPGPNPSNAKEKNIYPRQLLATVVFMTSLFQMGKPREFRLFIKKPEYQYYSHFPQVKLYEDEIPLSVLAEFPQNKDKIRVLHNRQPVWIKEINGNSGGYMLNFKGRVERPSIKNFILEETLNGPDVLLFGKVNENKFTIDVSSRISVFIGFAVALSSFDSRLMCE